ncbi:caspase family protein [Kamptonema sp. UHCC 0994]|uniref:caspase family protein n=1 Tax=Kamptonema sp. UHCC 0994 TaxID=3031329 RepID=UPI0023B98E8E|nr:caspase family protein [Kamptonema sp. UHCC 0994]MDF0554055.1 caspase family protein [Kamptonema sp. UHCC 0994]
MKRIALVIGINRYPLLKENPTDEPRNLATAARDAEAIARLLELYGAFEVHRLPAWEDTSQFDLIGLVKQSELEAAITQLFQPQSNRIPDTALLFFAGNGLRRKHEDDSTEGFLATSDSNPRKNLWGVSLRWLRQILQNSPVRQQIIWLDSSFSGELFNFTDTETSDRPLDRCFITACQKSEIAYARDGRGLLTRAIALALDPTKQGDYTTNDTLKSAIAQAFAQENLQHPICDISGTILLTATRREDIERLDFSEHPLEILWRHSRDWFADNEPEEVLMTHNANLVSKYFFGNPPDLEKAKGYKEAVETALGVTFPATWWEKENFIEILHECLKSLCGDFFHGCNEAGDRHISVGSAYLIALMVHQKTWGNIEPLTKFATATDWEWGKIKKAPKAFLFPYQDQNTSALSAKNLYDLFLHLFEKRGQASSSQIKKAFFDKEGKVLKIQFQWFANQAAEDSDKSLANWSSQLAQEDNILIPTQLKNTRYAILRVWRSMLASQDGFMGSGTIGMKKDTLILASLL